MQFVFTVILTVLLVLKVLAIPLATDDTVCAGGTILSKTFIGKDKNVEVDFVNCPGFAAISSGALETRQSDVCGATCETFCFHPAGGGPDPDECSVISEALVFESQETGSLFTIETGGNNTIAMKFNSCLTFFVNQDAADLAYCRVDWAGVINWVAPNCQSTQNAHGGLCVASDQRWFIQIQRS